MKRWWRRLISLLLVQAMLWSLGGAAFAAGPETKGDTVEETYLNPLYSGVVGEEDLTAPRKAGGVASLYSEEEYLDSVEEAGVQLRESMKQRQETIVVYFQAPEYSKELLVGISDAAMAHTGNPTEGDYLRWQYTGWRSSTSYYEEDGLLYMTITYTYTYMTTYAQEQEMDKAVQEALSGLSVTGKRDYETVSAVYDYICGHTVYDYDNLEDDSYTLKFTAYAALIDGKAVCQGYALLLYRLLLELGIDCRFISGTGNGGAHGWNIVELENLYYNADSTWDAGSTAYRYFLKCEENFGDHVRDEAYDTEAFHTSYPMAQEDYVVHSWDEGVVTAEPTCTEEGERTYTCQDCGETRTEPIPAKGHVTELRNGKAAACQEDGYTGDEVCTVCGQTIAAGSVIPATGHTWDEGVVTAEPACTEEGERTYTCQDCGETRTEPIPARGHVTELRNGKAAACQEDGYTGDEVCTVCGQTIAAGSVIPATGHTWDEGVITVQPTTESEGEITYTCTVCGETRTEVLPKVERDGWYYNEDNGKWYYYENGQMVTGWKKVKNVWYYMDADGTMHTGWLYVNNYWYYLKPSSGAMQTGWVAVNGKWYYTNSYGEMVTGWVKVKNKWYYMWDSGSMATGWVKANNKWYYMWDSGSMATGWVKVKNKWYYMWDSGSMATGWVKANNKWYYMWDSGSMATGWVKVNNKWYYMNSDGEMQTGWIRLGGKWYYLDASGAMVTGAVTINGKRYTFSSSGVLQ